MFLLNRRTMLKTGAAAALAPSLSHAAPTQLDTITASPMGAFVDSVMVVGDENALVIDAQLTQADAARLAEQVAATGRRLETVFITHIHPDHHMGVATLTQRFPDVRIKAHPAIAELLGQIGQGMFDGLKGNLGFAAGDTWTAPTAHDGPLMLEGTAFDVLDPMAGDTGLVTPVHLPQFDTLVAADIVYSAMDLYVAEATTAEAIAAWQASLTKLEGTGFGDIIPGHLGPDGPTGQAAIEFTRTYLNGWEQALAEATDRASLSSAMERILGADPNSFFTQEALKAAYP